MLALTAQERQRLSVSTEEAASASSSLWAGASSSVGFEYHVKDVPSALTRSRTRPGGIFYEDNCWRGRWYDLTVSNSAFQFTEEWRSALEALAEVTAGHLFISRLLIISRSPSFVVPQRA